MWNVREKKPNTNEGGIEEEEERQVCASETVIQRERERKPDVKRSKRELTNQNQIKN